MGKTHGYDSRKKAAQDSKRVGDVQQICKRASPSRLRDGDPEYNASLRLAIEGQGHFYA